MAMWSTKRLSWITSFPSRDSSRVEHCLKQCLPFLLGIKSELGWQRTCFYLFGSESDIEPTVAAPHEVLIFLHYSYCFLFEDVKQFLESLNSKLTSRASLGRLGKMLPYLTCVFS